MLLLGRLAGDAAEFHRLGGEAGLAGLVYDSDPRIRSVTVRARMGLRLPTASSFFQSRQKRTSVRLDLSCDPPELHPACSLRPRVLHGDLCGLRHLVEV